jgi:type IV pilus assembly protein PilN
MVEINLLPERRKAHPIVKLMTYALILTVLFATVYSIFSISRTSSDVEAIQKQIEAVQAERQTLQTQMEGLASNSIVSDYEDDVLTIEGYYISSVWILERFVENLPERGYFLDYSYEKNGQVDIYLQFDTLSEMSVFTDAISSFNWTSDVTITSIDIQKIADENEEVLPRYYVQYSVSLNMEDVKAEQEEGI